MNLLGITRSSNQDVADGYGSVIQEAELIDYAQTQGHNLIDTQHIIEPATLNLEDRELFRAVLAEAARLKALGQCDGLVFSRCDRLSRKMETAIQVALDLRKSGLSIHLVREKQILKPDDPPLNFVMYVLQAFGVDAQTRVFLANTREGQKKAAQAGKLPSGVGAKGLYGYNLVGAQGAKHFEPNGQVWIVDEVLKSGIAGHSINASTRQLQQKGIAITRDTVRKILNHARVYAGIYKWGKYEIPNLVPPRITLEQASTIEANMKCNQELSYGFGKRKWLTGKVRCGVCGGSFALELGKKRCHCRRFNRLENLNPCTAPKISYCKLEFIIWNILSGSFGQPGVLREKLTEMRAKWEEEKQKLETQVTNLEALLKSINEKRERLLWQHSEALITKEELTPQLKTILPQLEHISDRARQIRAMTLQPPPDPDLADKWANEWQGYAYDMQFAADDKQKEKIAEMCGLMVTIQPLEGGQLRLQLTAKIPLTIKQADINKAGEAVAIVCPSLRRKLDPFGKKHCPIPPVPPHAGKDVICLYEDCLSTSPP